MRQLIVALLFVPMLVASCKQEAAKEYSLVADRSLMPRQHVPVWPAGTAKDTCIEITEPEGKLITGSISVKNEPLGTYFNFSSGKGRHNVYDSMGFEMDRLEDGGKHYAYSYLYDTERKLLYKIGRRSRKGDVFLDTTITAYIGNQAFTAAQAEDGSLTITTSRYNERGQLVGERNEFYYPNMMIAPTGNRQHFNNRFYYSGNKIDSLVTIYPGNKPPFGKLKLVFDAAGLPQQALVEHEVVYSVFQVARCANSESVKPH